MRGMKRILLLLTLLTLFFGTARAADPKLDDRTIGQAPMKPYGIPAGNHVLEISADGYKPQKKDLSISAGQAQTLNFKLEIIPKSGRAHITSNQPFSTVKIDDKEIGTAP